MILALYHNPVRDGLTNDVLEMSLGYDNLLYTSSVCIQEMIYLCQIGKIGNEKNDEFTPQSIVPWSRGNDIRIVPINDVHLMEVAELSLHENHRDPNDRIIIAQAIADRIPLVSSDRKFEMYEEDGLEFIFNDRVKV